MALLLNPGPVTLTTRVRQALLRPDLCHREPEFSTLQSRIRQQLLTVYGLDSDLWSAILLTGSGSAAVEAMLTSLVPDTGQVLIPANGVYGERMARIAAIHGIGHDVIAHDWTVAIDAGAVERQLQRRRYSHIAIVHHETTTGRLNDLEQLAHLADQYGAKLLIDAVSSFGGEALDFRNWPVDAAAATANKCLHGVPGVSFVIARRSALEQAAVRSLYLDLASYHRAQENGNTPFTQSVQCCYALAEALAEFFDDGGLQARHEIYRRRMKIVWDGLTRLGIEPLIDESASSSVLNAFRLPAGMEYTRLHDYLKEAGFIIYAGQGEFAQTIFRIAVMGAIYDSDLERLVEEVGKLMSLKA